jgi:hypothetical protein
MPKNAVEKQRNNNGRNHQGRFLEGNANGFRPGASGNPKGRPKSITLSEAYRRALSQVVADDPQGRTYAEVIAEAVCKDAMAGNTTAAREIADRVEGKPRQAIEVDMAVTDWRELANRHGLKESDVLREAQQLIESATDAGDAQPD